MCDEPFAVSPSPFGYPPTASVDDKSICRLSQAASGCHEFPASSDKWREQYYSRYLPYGAGPLKAIVRYGTTERRGIIPPARCPEVQAAIERRMLVVCWLAVASA